MTGHAISGGIVTGHVLLWRTALYPDAALPACCSRSSQSSSYIFGARAKLERAGEPLEFKKAS